MHLATGGFTLTSFGLTLAGVIAFDILASACTDATKPGTDFPLRDRIIFESDRFDARGDIFSASLDGTDVRRLTDNTTSELCGSLSPDGQLIAVTSRTEADGVGVSLMRSDGSERHTLIPKGYNYYACAIWSPTESLMALRNADKIAIVTYDGVLAASIPRTTTYSYFESIAFSPDGTRLLISESDSQDGRIWTVAPNNTARTSVTRGISASWTPRGDSVLYTCFDPVFAYATDYRLCIAAADGTGRRVLTSSASNSPLLSPDGRRIAYQCDFSFLCFLNRDGTGFTRTTIQGRNFAWSPDSKSLIYECSLSEPGRANQEICAISSDGTNWRNLTQNAGADILPSFSPSSNR